MKPTQSLHLRQSQSLVMTQQLQQSIKLLQLSALELGEFVDQEIEQNPLLTRDEQEEAPSSDKVTEATESGAESLNEAQQVAANQESLDSNYGDGWQGDSNDGAGQRYDRVSSGGMGFDGDENSLEQTLSSEKTLREHLTEQLQMETVEDPAVRLATRQLIELLDEVGFLRESLDELAELLGADEELIEQAITLLHRLDPTGIGARSLPECLKLQLVERDLFDPMMAVLVEHIHLMEQGRLTELQGLCDADDEDFADMLAQIRQLDPYPARQFVNDLAQPVIPDVFMRKGKEQRWAVELNADALPRVLLDQTYYQELDGKARNKEDKRYLSERLGQANWLVKALDQRAQTIMKVSAEIIRQQENFFLYGIRFLKPLTLKDISTEVDLHESTVSRVTTNKFMSTPRGIFELKYFFTSSVGASSGEDDVSSKTVMYYIKELVGDESPHKILSDEALVKLLKERNVDVARRTVAKYREALNIPSSVVRRRQKKGV